ncbi:hypothetical protein CBL_08383 [Carabus blaptoides fortunei]
MARAGIASGMRGSASNPGRGSALLLHVCNQGVAVKRGYGTSQGGGRGMKEDVNGVWTNGAWREKWGTSGWACLSKGFPGRSTGSGAPPAAKLAQLTPGQQDLIK